MEPEDLKTIEQLADFLSGTPAVAFSVIIGKEECLWLSPIRSDSFPVARERCAPIRQSLFRYVFLQFL